MGKNRRAGRKHTVKPKMWIRCVCGQTLGNVDRPRHPDGRPVDPLWMIGGLSYTSTYNSHHGDKYEHDHFGKVHTHTFKCTYVEQQSPEVLKLPTPEEVISYAEEETLKEIMGEELPFRMSKAAALRYKVTGELPEIDNEDRIHPALKANPARFTESGVTPRPRDVKRGDRRCGRVHTVRGQRILGHWNELAGITEDTPYMDAMRTEKAAYLAAGKNWVMILGE